MIFDLHSDGYNYCKLGCAKASMQLRCETIRLVQWTSDELSWRWMDFYIPNTKKSYNKSSIEATNHWTITS